MLPVVILAGGLATRLRPQTLRIPKSMIEIDGMPFIHHQLRLLHEKGVTEAVLCIGFLGEMIEAYVGDGSQYGLSVKYSYDGERLLGTGGAIKKASAMLPDAFFVTYGDSYLDIDLEPLVHRFYDTGYPVLMTVYRNRDAFDKSNVQIRDGKIIRYSKTDDDPLLEYIDYGLLIFRSEVFNRYPEGLPFDLSEVLNDIVQKGEATPFEVSQRFYEIGSPGGIVETEAYIRNRT